MPFEPQPHLTGELLELRPLRPDDFDALYAVAADPLVWEQHPAHDRWQEPVFREFFQRGIDSGGAFAVINRADGRIVGSSRYFAYFEERRDVEIGWTFLARSHWGGRYNGEMKRLMLDHAFRFVDRVYFIVGPGNRRSQRAVEKLGATRTGERPDHYGTKSLVFTLERERWTADR
ncbi:MAG TPA: GNAT family N-acetyltransferase [Vicinamibacterales bacterium]|jgi:RimJ/RimL family protein N-acetyltransferase